MENKMLFIDTEQIKILLPAWKIPEGETVTKPTGTKEYQLRKDIRVFNQIKREDGYTITAEKGTLLLVYETNINIISANDTLGWVTSFESLYYRLQYEEAGWK